VSAETQPPAVLDRDIELAKARALMADMLHALRYAAGDEHADYRNEVAERTKAFLTETDYLGVAHAARTTEARVWRRQAAHAAKTLRARAERVANHLLWDQPEWLARLEVKGGADMLAGANMPTAVPVDKSAQAWIGTFTPEAGCALADVFEGKGSLAALARALLFRPQQVETDDEDEG
jgi:hypothetical protein